MPGNIKIFYNIKTGKEYGDVGFDASDFIFDDALDTLVLILFLTDARVPVREALGSRRGGFWGDPYLTEFESSLGSWLWLLARANMGKETFRKAEQYATQALEPLKTWELVTSIDASASNDEHYLNILIKLTLDNGAIKKYNIKIRRLA